MKSSNPLYSILAVYIPWSLLVTGAPLIGRIITRLLPGISFPYASIFVLALLCSITASIYLGMMKNLRGDHKAANFRGAIIVTAAAYLIASLLRQNHAAGLTGVSRFMPGVLLLPDPANILGALTALYVWIFVLYLGEIFKARELFESHTRNYEGENLRRIMLEDSSLMGDADANIRKLITLYGTQLAAVGVLAIVSGAMKIPVPPAFLILLVILYVSAACIFAILELFRKEQSFAGEGIAVPAPARSRRITAILFFSLFASAAALLFATGSNILPVSIITGFLAWLLSLFARLNKPGEAPNFSPETFMPEPSPRMDLQQLMGAEPSPPWPFWNYLRYAAIILLAMGFIWFMINPLLTRSPGGKIPFRLKLARMVLQWFSALRRGLAYFFASLRKNDGSIKMRRPGAAAVKTMAADLLAAYSRAKKRNMKNSVTLFARLILWGTETLRVSWKPSCGPGEYCVALGLALAGSAYSNTANDMKKTCGAIIRCGELFEEALYSADALSGEKQREFREMVEMVTG
ncbi:hypothetical protein AGMMS50268_06560 [Spirochaetia bacterium]|nr:hypothetical protein AGMMS50268_06560 [Spirochaetia bacterium]